MAQINFSSIAKKAAASKKVGLKVHDRVEPIFDRQKERMLKDFDNHVITKELRDEGPEGTNISATLPDGYGNLFSFIGFFAGDDPTTEVREVLENIEFPERAFSTSFVKGGQINFTYRVNLPNYDDFASLTYPDNWRDGSWVEGIENGIPGFESYYFDESIDAYVQSRSTTALQAKDGARNLVIIREGIYNPVQYIGQILDNFRSRLK